MKERTIYWGDLHGHTTLSDGNYNLVTGIRDRDDNTPDVHLRVARDLAKLDFVAVSDHDYRMNKEKWDLLVEETNRFNTPGHFVAFAGIEWGHVSGETQEERIALACGHKVAIWPGEFPPYFDWPGSSVEDYFRIVKDHDGVGYMAHPCYYSLSDFSITDPHAEVGIAMAYAEDAFTCSCEYPECAAWFYDSTPGYSVQEALARGLRLGFFGESDTHHGMPGSGPLLGIHAEDLSRESLVRAIRERKTSATTGARIDFEEFSVGGADLGGEVVGQGNRIPVRLSIHGSAPLMQVELVCGWEGAATPFPSVLIERPEREIVDIETEIDLPQRPCFVYPRVLQADRHFGWASPVWID